LLKNQGNPQDGDGKSDDKSDGTAKRPH
jgi:hypothetical protein